MGIVNADKLRILITGSNGLLGQHIVRYCLNNGLEFLATSSKDNKISYCPSTAFQVLDISSKTKVEQIIKSYQPTHIVNAAAMTNVDLCETEKDACYRINKDGVENIIDTIKNSSIHLIHISTDFIFDGKKRLYQEGDRANPLGEYGKSKWEAETLLLQSQIKRLTILRTSILYGVGEHLEKKNIFNWAMDQLRGGNTINIVNDQYRTPTFVEDLVQACFKSIKKKKYGTYHVAGPELYSMYELICIVAKYVGVAPERVKPISTEDLNQKAPRPQSSGLLIEKAKELLNYQPTRFVETLSKIDPTK
ncbi:MAG: SDR family oxidoreductase [Brumimicrobium sp.]|nr:SDR family oxidoreductase [Brumimicrobium sp.]